MTDQPHVGIKNLRLAGAIVCALASAVWGTPSAGAAPASLTAAPSTGDHALGTLASPPVDNAAAPAKPETASPVERTTLPDGMRVVVKNEPGAPLIAVDVFVKISSDQETPETAGIGNFVADTLLASTGSRTPDVIQSEIAALGGNVSVDREPDWTYISSLTVPDKYDDLVSLLTDVMKDATFDNDVVEERRQDILAEIDNGQASVFDRVYNNLRGDLFSDTGYGLPSLGTARSIQRLPQSQLLRYYREYFVPKNMVVVIVGDIDPARATATFSDDMQDYNPLLRGSRRRLPEENPLPILTSDPPPVHDYDTDLSEICVMAGFRAPSMASEDYPALQVLNALLGGMKTSRMFTNLREKQGLAYDLGSFYSPQLYAGDLTAYAFAASTRPDPSTHKDAALAEIKDQVLQQIDSFTKVPPTGAELERAKHYLIGAYAIKHERIEDRATLLGIAELTSPYGADMDIDYAKYIDAVTADDVMRVAQKYLVHPVISTIEPDPRNGGVVSE